MGFLGRALTELGGVTMNTKTIAIVVVLSCFVLFIAVVIFVFVYRWEKKQKASLQPLQLEVNKLNNKYKNHGNSIADLMSARFDDGRLSKEQVKALGTPEEVSRQIEDFKCKSPKTFYQIEQAYIKIHERPNPIAGVDHLDKKQKLSQL